MNDTALSKFLRAYGGVEAPQDPIEASTDGQIKSLATLLAVEFSTPANAGVLIDVGAGRGTLLARLVDINGFRQSSWAYVGIEDPAHHTEIVGHGVHAGIHKRVDVLAIPAFYASWPEVPDDVRQVVVIRNVLHELGIPETVQLLHHLARNINIGDLLIIQDLGVFPVAEKSNACWDSGVLAALLMNMGFSITTTNEPTRSGNFWFNIVAKRNAAPDLSKKRIEDLVIKARTGQWHAWAQAGALSAVAIGRDDRVAKIDFDLQFAALTLQLYAVGAPGVSKLTRRQEQLAALETFERALTGAKFDNQYDAADIAPIRHFKNRANSQDRLQAFLAEDVEKRAIALVHGPALMGKSALVQHVLSSFGHRRKFVYIDALASWSVWNLLESIFSACDVRIPTEITGRMRHVTLDTILDPVRSFALKAAPRIVLVVDHFERLLRPDSTMSPELRRVFEIWATAPSAKIVFTSRRSVPETLLTGAVIDLDHPPVGRFPEGPHVENLLSFFLPVKKFPPSLVDAIDRHPFMAELTGRIIEKEGETSLTDETLLFQLRHRLRNRLVERASTELSRPALEALMHTRTAVPRAAAYAVAGSASVQDALETGLVYEVPARSGDHLVSCIRGFRYEANEDEEEPGLPSHAVKIHKAWASALHEHYRKVDDDPRWLREAFFHTAVSGSREELAVVGQQYRSELQDAGEYWFRKGKDFENALWAFKRVQEFSEEEDPFVNMRIASCLIRCGDPDAGLQMFEKLFGEYPDWLGCRTSCVDGLLFLRRYQDALDLLLQFAKYENLTDERDRWMLGQYGRAYAGLERLGDAVDAFTRQLKLDDSPVVIRALARVLHRLGRRDEEGSVLERGHRAHPESTSILAAYATWLESNGRAERAVELLSSSIEQDPENAWLAFPYVQGLVGTERVSEARAYFARLGHNLHPPFMRRTVEAQILKAEGRFELAIDLLDEQSEDERDAHHRIGQRAEVYVAWAANASTAERRVEVGRKGLADLPRDSKNLLINVSVLKLSLAAHDRDRFAVTLEATRRINPDSDDVKRLEAQGREQFGDLH